MSSYFQGQHPFWHGQTQAPSFRPWGLFLEGSLRRQAQEAALFVAERLCDPTLIQQVVEKSDRHKSSSTIWGLPPPSTFAELALFYHYLTQCFPTPRWDTVGRQYLHLIAPASQRVGLSSFALHGGISGIAFILQVYSKDNQRYRGTLATLQQALVQRIRHNLPKHSTDTENIDESDFDVMTGVTGVVAYLLSLPSLDEQMEEAFRILLTSLLWLAEPGQTLGQERWLSFGSPFESEDMRQRFPLGRFNCGLAHGIPGPLAALSLTELSGYRIAGVRDAIAFVSDWLILHQIHDEWGIAWPSLLPREAAAIPESWQRLAPARMAWCYGAPGVARSLWLAGQALEDSKICQIALQAMEAALLRPPSARKIDAPTICHGLAGLLLICLRFAQESQHPFLLERIPELVEQILALFDPESLFGFRDLNGDQKQVDRPNWLTGASGTAMALLAASCSVEPSWDRLLLLA